MGQSGGTLHLADYWMEAAVGMLRRAQVAQARVGLGSEAFQHRGCEPRFAEPGLAGEQHISFWRNTASYCPRPRLRSQTTTSMMAPELRLGAYHRRRGSERSWAAS